MIAATTSVWLAVLALSLLSIGSTLVGVALARSVGHRVEAQAIGIGFSVGLMIAIAAGELLPEASAQTGPTETVVAALVGAGLVASLNLVLPHVHLFSEDRGIGPGSALAPFLVAFGLIIHDLPEGFAMANAYVATPELGVLVAVAIAVHNIPEEFAIALPAVMAGRRRLLVWTAVTSAAAEPVGALLGLAGASLVPGLNAALLAVAAGAMLFVSIHELIPMARSLGHRGHTAGGAALGALTFGALSLLVGA